jgi:glycosyltransferase involved in cell wall biosynthesis
MARRAGAHELLIGLNGRFPEAAEDIKVAFAGLVDPAHIKAWLPTAQPGSVAKTSGDVIADEKLYEAFIASLKPDTVHVSSLFEGLGDASVTSIGRFAKTSTSVTLYDLIPLIYPHPYLDNPSVREWYMRKVEAMKRASLWLAISESSRQEGITHLGLDPDACVNVSTAAGDHFTKVDVPRERNEQLRSQYRLYKPFVMYTGGIDHRKNIEGLIRAFGMLPPAMRSAHQLAIVCSARQEDRAALLDLARRQGLTDDDVAVTGFVPEQDLVDLYNLCALFVFPSWHEGFGLPALEAMLCGAPVIGANTSSLPEVIGWSDALFDPRDDAAIAAKMAQALSDASFRNALIEHGEQQAKKFSWDESARRAIAALEEMHESKADFAKTANHSNSKSRPRLAYVSPLPPERSGIAAYSAELLPALAEFYDIELITDLPSVDRREMPTAFPIRSVASFRDFATNFDRVLYHFGNSEFHQHMFGLLQDIPGVVVLHDFYLSGVQAHREIAGGEAFAWTRALYESHGYGAVADRQNARDSGDVVFKYPCNFDVLRHANGVIVHSPYSIQLANEWFGSQLASKWALIPHLRVAPGSIEIARARSRAELGLAPEEFLVCAFGLLGPTKMNDRLLDAWKTSSLAADPNCRLVFVGENNKEPYGQRLAQAIASAAGAKISITGWADSETFQRYLSAADAAVQLRTLSRGETSGTVLDAMSRGIPTVVNANGSMAFLPKDAVMMLNDGFSDAELVEALEKLRHSPGIAKTLGENARRQIETAHAPASCARAYFEAIEAFAVEAEKGRPGLIRSIATDSTLTESSLVESARSIARALPLPAPKRQLFVDVSELVQKDWQSGIQRLVKSLLRALFESPPEGYRIEPVYALKGLRGYSYARKFSLQFLGCSSKSLQDAPIDAREGDVFVGLDLQPHLVPEQTSFFQELRQIGVKVNFVVYDLLPILLEHRFLQGAREVHERWLTAVAKSDGVLAISKAVAAEFTAWLSAHSPEQLAAGLEVRTFRLGADISSSSLPADMPVTEQPPPLASIATSSPSFLMVGTIEPRKGHEQALGAFEQLWREGHQANLVIVGKKGWMVDALVTRLKQHPQRDKQLFWLDSLSDAHLEQLYSTCDCLLLASEGEGFGLPLIEAAMHELPIVVRDLPVFREVAADHAFYFDGVTSEDLAAALIQWLALFRQDRHPRSETMSYLTWQQSAEEFKSALLGHDDPKPNLHAAEATAGRTNAPQEQLRDPVTQLERESR